MYKLNNVILGLVCLFVLSNHFSPDPNYYADYYTLIILKTPLKQKGLQDHGLYWTDVKKNKDK